MPATTRLGARTYVGVPVVRDDGSFVGTLCGLDPERRPPDPDKAQLVALLARLLAFQLDRDEHLRAERRSREALEVLAADLRARSERDEALLGIVSHDLKNPLAAITTGAAILGARAGGDERLARLGRRLESAAARATRLVHDLLDLAATRHAVLPLRPRPAELGAIVMPVVDELRLAHPGRVIEVVASGSLEGHWDPDRLAQLVGNLLANALAYGEPGGAVTIDLGATAVDRVAIGVHNDGDPIPEALLPELFEPLKRGRGGPAGSIGLGLYIVKAIAESHGGEVRVSSRAGEGTTFTVDLPRLVETDRPTATPSGDGAASPDGPETSPRP